MTKNNLQNQDALLKEILPLPSKKIISNRFSAKNEDQMGECSGKCDSGVCRT